MPRTLVPVLVAGLVLAGAAPAAPPESPTSFIGAMQLKALLDRGTRAEIIDVRRWEEYSEMHIKGARSIPLRSLPTRAPEISKTELVVLY